MRLLIAAAGTWMRRTGAAWRRDQSAASLVEFAIVAPVFVVILCGVVQVGGLFLLRNNMTEVARDTARRVAVGELTLASAPSYAQGKLVGWGSTFTVTATNPVAGDVRIDISVPMADASLVDLAGLFQEGTMAASVTMRME